MRSTQTVTLPRRTAGRAVAAVGLVALVALAGCAGGDGSPSPARAHLAPLDVDPGVVHVHGLGVDPADGTLYAATHSGLFRLPVGGTAVRVGNRAQDTMGFAVVGPKQFIGSGHPDPREDDVRPPLLGLIESSDAGETWQRLSLHGKADFHVLRPAHGRTYGYDSTSRTLMVTLDGRDWDRRAQLLVGDFVVSPSSPDVLLARTERGLAQSLDGGRTFRPIAGPPDVALLSWTSRGVLAVRTDGSVHLSAGVGSPWAKVGTAAADPEALYVDERDGRQTIYVATASAGILMSEDGGRTFSTRYHDQSHSP